MTGQEFPPEVVEAVADAIVQAIPLPKNRALNVLRTLHALGYQRVGPGDVVVPREPTEAMVNTGTIVALEHRLERGHRSRYSGSNAGEVYAAYRAMLAAAPARGDGA
jgi:hypothetical protein